MFGLLSKLAELLAQYGTGFLTLRRTAKDTDVAAAMLRCAVALQDLCVRGDRLLALAEEMVDGATRPGLAEEFADLLEHQVTAVGSLRAALADCQALMATVDAGIYVELAPFLDAKSGLLTRWDQQAALSRFSTTTLFFLPAETLDRVLAIGRDHATEEGMTGDRTEYLLAVAEGTRAARSREVRDLSRPVAARQVPTVREEIATAKADLVRARALCGQLLAAMQEAVGPEAMAHLRRKLVSKPSHR
ncbi:hypothetical protein GCM10010193_28640 [Kitasatospora atroaurantiaca]|uniref:Uncharacterized protein n=1 Tax=Kitasatospora atroaurantiaca TaxID=285545 RepID=A0A561EJ38_9ACTN|nr:hypothetical protein [Kitasatospora atroaurantiaca]TWE15582.1 hypothetical protein FB465_0483 [Kitasatospora atroaurantiaca]